MRYLKTFESKLSPKFRKGDYVKRIPWGINVQHDDNIYKITNVAKDNSEDQELDEYSDYIYKYRLKNMTGHINRLDWEQELYYAPEHEVAALKYNL